MEVYESDSRLMPPICLEWPSSRPVQLGQETESPSLTHGQQAHVRGAEYLGHGVASAISVTSHREMVLMMST